MLGKDKCFNSNATFSEYDLIHVPSLLIFLVQNHHCFVMLHLVLVSVRSRRKIHLTSFSGSVTSESSHCPSADPSQTTTCGNYSFDCTINFILGHLSKYLNACQLSVLHTYGCQLFPSADSTG